jgi:hypothetical protein
LTEVFLQVKSAPPEEKISSITSLSKTLTLCGSGIITIIMGHVGYTSYPSTLEAPRQEYLGLTTKQTERNKVP